MLGTRNCRFPCNDDRAAYDSSSLPPRRRRSRSSGNQRGAGKQRSISLALAPVSTDSVHSMETGDAALDALQAELEHQVPFVRRISTPPAWRRPWLASPRESPVSQESVDSESIGASPPLTIAHPPSLAPPDKKRPVPSIGHRMQDISPTMLEKVLHELLPLGQEKPVLQGLTSKQHAQNGSSRSTSKQRNQNRRLALSPEPATPRSPGSVVARASLSLLEAEAEVSAFRSALSKSYGNLTRAFRAMKNAVSLHAKGIIGQSNCNSSVESCRLTCSELEWCVSAYLHYGDRRLARRIFAAIHKEGQDDIGLLDLAPEGASLFSLVEFRRFLLERHNSLERAFRELEEYLSSTNVRPRGRGGRTVPLAEFVKATAFFGLAPQQAAHFFSVMDADGDGSLTLSEFLEALTHMPRAVLLSDMRQRLLVRYPSVPHAFRELPHVAGRLGREGFAAALAKLGIVDIEAAEIFRLCDDDNSGDVSLDELREAMRDVSPAISLSAFWQRFAAEWPEIVAATTQAGSSGRTAAGALILELLPEELQRACAVPSSSTFAALGAGIQSSRSSAKRALSSLTLEAFDALAVLLDISKANGYEIFDKIQRAASLRRRPATPKPQHCSAEEGNCESPIVRREEKHIVYAEDFFDQLNLWTQNPCRAAGDVLDPNRDLVQEMVAPTKAAISALKAELVSSSVPQKSREMSPRRVPPTSRVAPKRLPKLPWRSFGGSRDPAIIMV